MAERQRLPEAGLHARGEHREGLLVGLRVERHPQRGTRPLAECAFGRLQVAREFLLHARVTDDGQRVAQRAHALGRRDRLDRMAERDGERLRRRGFRDRRRDAYPRQQRPDQRAQPCFVAIGGHARGAGQHLRVVGRERAIGFVWHGAGMQRGDLSRRFGQRVARERDVRGFFRERHGRIAEVEPQPLRREIAVVRRSQCE
ncbi:hypothetical protein [Burkholderia cenocepacia]|uniref:hypothetical protein n=1 Tax=Burkholderia cenocepacia TaxID=95486 RepID=UPI0031FE911E